MATTEQIVKRFLSHPGVSIPWVITQLYGENNRNTSAKFAHKRKGTAGRHFTEEELLLLNQIRRRLLGDLLE